MGGNVSAASAEAANIELNEQDINKLSLLSEYDTFSFDISTDVRAVTDTLSAQLEDEWVHNSVRKWVSDCFI